MGTEVDPRYSYEQMQKNVFASREELNGMAGIILDVKTGWFSIIVNTIRIVALGVLFWIRKRQFEEEMLLGKQLYERRRVDDVKKEQDKDDMDGKKKT